MAHSNEAYIYTFVNKINGKVYIGSRAAYDGTAEEDFLNTYDSSSDNEEFRTAMSNGELDAEILFVMYGEYSKIAKMAVKVENQMIKTFWDKYGKDMSYNRFCNVDGTWNTAGTTASDETRAKLSENSAMADPTRCWWNTKTEEELLEVRKNISLNHADLSGDKNPNYAKTFSDEVRNKLKAAWTPERKAKQSALQKGNLNYGNHDSKPKFKWLTPDGTIEVRSKMHQKAYIRDGWILIGPE